MNIAPFDRVPLWCFSIVAFFLSMLAVVLGFRVGGWRHARRSPEMPVLALAFAVVLLLIVDLDRGQEGFLQVSQQPIIDVLGMMK